ncbi:MAG TPA: LptA/OstA family protein [Magnetospirillaceae bacterium]|nr:LptA/OstA family protein [Magnetospirillaceae bacterium]
MKKAATFRIAAGLIAASLAAAAPLVLAKDTKPAPAAKAPAAPAQPANDIGFARGSSGQPLDVTADQGIEFSKDAKEIIARVNAKAVRANTTVTADTLTAYYRDKTPPAPGAQAAKDKKPAPTPDPTPVPGDKPADGTGTGGSEVWRVTADGNVDIFTPTQHAYGDHADYNIDDAVVVLTGDHLKMTTPQDIVTARDTLEYWENKHQAVARGDAVAIAPAKGQRIQADTLVADFGENKQKEMVIQVAHGYDHVVLTTATDVVTGDRADYVVETGIVTVTGSVKITRGGNQFDGNYAVVNLNTGISKLLSAPAGKPADRQVRGLFVPAPKKAPTPPPDTAPKGP